MIYQSSVRLGIMVKREIEEEAEELHKTRIRDLQKNEPRQRHQQNNNFN